MIQDGPSLDYLQWCCVMDPCISWQSWLHDLHRNFNFRFKSEEPHCNGRNLQNFIADHTQQFHWKSFTFSPSSQTLDMRTTKDHQLNADDLLNSYSENYEASVKWAVALANFSWMATDNKISSDCMYSLSHSSCNCKLIPEHFPPFLLVLF